MNAPLWLAIAAGGAIGAVARHGVSRAALHLMGPAFPWGTLTANTLGSFLMGVLVAWLSRHNGSATPLSAFLTVGVLGAFTTFSTFALDAVMLAKDRSLTIAGVYVGASIILSIAGLAAGFAAVKAAS